MTQNRVQFTDELLAYGPQLPLADLVVAVNRLFHDVEAAHYDARHPEVHQQLPPLWREMIAVAARQLAGQPWRVLDFGCGTGFEASQVLATVPQLVGQPVKRLACVDLSPAMVEQCRRNLTANDKTPTTPISYSTSVHDVAAPAERFNVLLTNSLVHHLPNVTALRDAVEGLLSPGAVWLAGHEPSRRYYANSECLKLLDAYRRWQKGPSARWGRLWSRESWRRRLARRTQSAISPKRETAHRAVERGLFRRVPPPHLIDRLVDFRVAHDAAEARAGRGLDLSELATELAPCWQRTWQRSYSFLGPYFESTAPQDWQQQAERLARRFPDDGANFCAVWARGSENTTPIDAES